MPTDPHIVGSGCGGQGEAKEQRLEQGLGRPKDLGCGSVAPILSLPTGSRSSGSTRSDGGAGRTGRPEDRAPESKSGSGSESEPSSRGGSLRRGGEPGGTGDGGPPPSRGSSGGAPNLRAHPGLHPYGPPPGMALPYNPMMVVMMPPPPPPVPPAVQPPGVENSALKGKGLSYSAQQALGPGVGTY